MSWDPLKGDIGCHGYGSDNFPIVLESFQIVLFFNSPFSECFVDRLGIRENGDVVILFFVSVKMS